MAEYISPSIPFQPLGELTVRLTTDTALGWVEPHRNQNRQCFQICLYTPKISVFVGFRKSLNIVVFKLLSLFSTGTIIFVQFLFIYLRTYLLTVHKKIFIGLPTQFNTFNSLKIFHDHDSYLSFTLALVPTALTGGKWPSRILMFTREVQSVRAKQAVIDRALEV